MNPTTTQAAYYVAYTLADRAGLAHRSTTRKAAERKLARLADRPGTRCIVAISGTYRPDKVSTTRPDQVKAFVAANDIAVAGGAPMPRFLADAMAATLAPAPAPTVATVAPATVDAGEGDDGWGDDDDAMLDYYGSDEAAIMAELDYASTQAGIDF